MSVTKGLNSAHEAITTSIANGNHQSNGDIRGTVDQSELRVYLVLHQYHSQPKNLRVLCAGAGAAGLLLAYKIQKLMTNYEFVFYEK
jgi:malic enzyme